MSVLTRSMTRRQRDEHVDFMRMQMELDDVSRVSNIRKNTLDRIAYIIIGAIILFNVYLIYKN